MLMQINSYMVPGPRVGWPGWPTDGHGLEELDGHQRKQYLFELEHKFGRGHSKD